MDKRGILEFLNQNTVVYLSTCAGSQPHVRGMLLYRADENGIIFHTGKMKDLHQQLVANPHVEVCAFSQAENKQVRLEGIAELVQDEDLRNEIVGERPFMKPWLEQFGLDVLAVWRIKPSRAFVWTIETNFAPKEYIPF